MKIINRVRLFIFVIAWAGVSSCAFADTQDVAATDMDTADTSTQVYDPLERVNRVVFQFNDLLDRAILKPVATVYNKVTPKPISKAISNFFSNFYTPATVVNDLLQGNIYQTVSDSWRFVFNTTVGVLGFFDVASAIGLEPNSEDVGLTLARWGYKKSMYLMLPIFGPSTLRDGVGMLGYYYLTPYPYISPVRAQYQIYALDIVSRRANLLHYQGVFDQAAFDKYTFIRDAYLQRRAYQIERNTQLGDPYLEKNDLDKTLPAEKKMPSPLDEL